MRNFWVILTLFMSVFFSCIQKPNKETNVVLIRPSIEKLASDIANDNVLKSAGVGYAGLRTAQWGRYGTLNASATDEELKILTDNQNPVVRCYAFQALSHRTNVDLDPILIKHLSDTAQVQTFFGCIKNVEKTGDYFLDVYAPAYADDSSQKLKKHRRKLVDSILLFDKTIRLSAKYNLLGILKPDLRYYNRIKEIAITENNPEATLALAKFRSKADIDIIAKLFNNETTEYYAIYSVREFPELSFYPKLVRVFEKEWAEKLYDYPKWRILYQALARYPTKETLALFERTIQSKDDFRRQTLGADLVIAIKKYPNNVYKRLMEKIRLDNDISLDGTREMSSEE
jgi:hypothetical protein